MLKCPNCGAPLSGTSSTAQRACGYCGALLQLPPSAPPPVAPWPVHAPPRRSLGAVWGLSALSLLGVALVAGIAAVRAITANPEPARAAPGAAIAAAPPDKPVSIAWSRLEAIDIHATVDQAKVSVKQQFPEASVEQDKTYRLNLDHPILTDAIYPWEWGCACLDHIVFSFKDYPTRMKTAEAFIPCLTRGFGPLTSSNPPFDYEWAAHGDLPYVRLGPQALFILIQPNTSEAAYRNALRVLDGCRN